VKVLLIVNPYASSVSSASRQAAIDALSQDGHELSVAETNFPPESNQAIDSGIGVSSM